MIIRSIRGLLEKGFNELAVCRTGLMIFNRHDQFIGSSLRKYGEYCPGELVIFGQSVEPGDTVIEVGANIGAHTVDLSRLVGPTGVVRAFEPQRLTFQTLCANLALNSCTNVFTYQAALGASDGEVLVPFLPPDQPANFGGVSLVGVEAGERVPMYTLDSMNFPECHLLKLDVEGMELEVLKGAVCLINEKRPLIYLENDRQDKSAALIQHLFDANYRLYSHLPPLFTLDNFAEDPENIFGDIVSVNLLGVPAERNVVVKGAREGKHAA